VVFVTMLHEQQAQRGLRSWSRTRWMLLAGLVLAAIVIAVLVLIYSGGGGSGGGGGGY
jgi:Flp pilus assembly protein TadB